MNRVNKECTFVKLDDIDNIDTFHQKLKLVFNIGYTNNTKIPKKINSHRNTDYMNIKYNYFHDLWDDFVLDTGFINMKGLFVSNDKATIIFDPDHKVSKILTQVLNYVKDNLDNIISHYNLKIKNDDENCTLLIKKQNKPTYYIKFGKKYTNCIFLGSKAKNFENINITEAAQLPKMYYSNITDCRLILKPCISISEDNIWISMNITKSEFKYSSAYVKSELDKNSNKMTIMNNNNHNSCTINI
jgi:hypothetical protein